MNNFMRDCAKVTRATRAARARTGGNVGTRIKAGAFQVVRVAYDANGRSTVTPLSEYITAHEAARILNNMGKD